MNPTNHPSLTLGPVCSKIGSFHVAAHRCVLSVVLNAAAPGRVHKAFPRILLHSIPPCRSPQAQLHSGMAGIHPAPGIHPCSPQEGKSREGGKPGEESTQEDGAAAELWMQDSLAGKAQQNPLTFHCTVLLSPGTSIS